jgi:hypothetical protein
MPILFTAQLLRLFDLRTDDEILHQRSHGGCDDRQVRATHGGSGGCSAGDLQEGDLSCNQRVGALNAARRRDNFDL